MLQSKLYTSVIDDVISGVREAFLDEGVDEQVLQELRQVWEGKLMSSKALEQPEPSEPQPPLINSQKAVASKPSKFCFSGLESLSTTWRKELPLFPASLGINDYFDSILEWLIWSYLYIVLISAVNCYWHLPFLDPGHILDTHTPNLVTKPTTELPPLLL